MFFCLLYFIYLFWYLELNSGPCAYQAGALLLSCILAPKMWGFKTTLKASNLNISSNKPTEILIALKLLTFTDTGLYSGTLVHKHFCLQTM